LLVYDILITISSRHGFGQDVAAIPTREEEILARLTADSAQSLLVIGMVVAKTSQAFYLLRIAATRKQKIVILTPDIILGVATPIAVIVLWVSCRPIAYAWDLSIEDGTCNLLLQGGFAIVTGAWAVIVDLWYAAFPWYLLARLQMPSRQKIMIGISMSFGVV
jgi:hypothetical protein